MLRAEDALRTLLSSSASPNSCPKRIFLPAETNAFAWPLKRDKKWGNFREWAKNQHPVLSMWMAHELHPFTRAERLSVLLCYLCWAFFITVIFESVSLSGDGREGSGEGGGGLLTCRARLGGNKSRNIVHVPGGTDRSLLPPEPLPVISRVALLLSAQPGFKQLITILSSSAHHIVDIRFRIYSSTIRKT